MITQKDNLRHVAKANKIICVVYISLKLLMPKNESKTSYFFPENEPQTLLKNFLNFQQFEPQLLIKNILIKNN